MLVARRRGHRPRLQWLSVSQEPSLRAVLEWRPRRQLTTMKLHGRNIIACGTIDGSAGLSARWTPSPREALPHSLKRPASGTSRRRLKQPQETLNRFERSHASSELHFWSRSEKKFSHLAMICSSPRSAETALPIAERLAGERGRTVNQLKMFAALIREGSWVDARIDRGIPGRKPFPRPDIRRMLIPMGPVAVFSASNFPLAFSVAGGDTASALAAGCPVVVKAHPAHPATSELTARAVINAARKNRHASRRVFPAPEYAQRNGRRGSAAPARKSGRLHRFLTRWTGPLRRRVSQGRNRFRYMPRWAARIRCSSCREL